MSTSKTTKATASRDSQERNAIPHRRSSLDQRATKEKTA